MWFLALIGILWFPRFTLGCTLIHYDHPILGTISILLAIIEYKLT